MWLCVCVGGGGGIARVRAGGGGGGGGGGAFIIAPGSSISQSKWYLYGAKPYVLSACYKIGCRKWCIMIMNKALRAKCGCVSGSGHRQQRLHALYAAAVGGLQRMLGNGAGAGGARGWRARARPQLPKLPAHCHPIRRQTGTVLSQEGVRGGKEKWDSCLASSLTR